MFQRLAGSRLLRVFSGAVIDQAMLSAASLAVGLLLIRFAETEQYAHFLLVQTSIALLIAAQNSWIGGPMAVLMPRKSVEEQRQMVGAIDQSQRRATDRVTLMALLAPITGYLTGLWNAEHAMVGFVGVLAGWMALRREFMRTLMVNYSRSTDLLRSDAVYVVALLAGAVISVLIPGPTSVWATLALVLASLAGAVHARRIFAASPGWVGGPAGEYWAQMRPFGIWATVGAVTYWVYTQSYNYVLAARLDLEAVAHVNQVRLMLMPAYLVVNGVVRMLLPITAEWLQRIGLVALVRKLWMIVGALLLVDVAYLLVLWLFRDWVTGTVMNVVIPDRDRLILLWALHVAIGSIRDTLQCGLLALGRFKILAALIAIYALISIAAMWTGIGRFGAAGALIGVLVGEVISLGCVAVLLWQSLRRARRQASAEP